jgi:hypothetical protein
MPDPSLTLLDALALIGTFAVTYVIIRALGRLALAILDRLTRTEDGA